MTTILLQADDETTATLPYLTNADTNALGHYVGTLAEHMGLWDWTIILDTNPPDGEADTYAQIKPTFGQRRARLRFAENVRTWPPDRLRRVVVHELVHCHLDRMDTVYNDVARELGPQARRIADATWESEIEDATDNIAEAWARTLPMIAWPESRPSSIREQIED